jgi:hypothetical protein
MGYFVLDGGAILFSECGVQFFLSRKGRKYDVLPFSVFSLCVHHGKVDLQRAIYAIALSCGFYYLYSGDSYTYSFVFIFTEVMALGSISYAVLFTTMSAIALKAKSNNTLVAVLGFPILIPLLIFITKITSAALGDITMQELVTKNLLCC